MNAGPDVQIELEFRIVGFCGGRETKDPGEKFSDQTTTPGTPCPS